MRVDWGGLCAALQTHCTQVQDHAMQLQCTTATSCHPHCAPTQPRGSLPSPHNACILFIFIRMLHIRVCKIADRIKEAKARMSLYLNFFLFLHYLVQPVSGLGEWYGNTGGHTAAGSVTVGETGNGSFSFQWGETQLDRFTQQQYSFGQRMPEAEMQGKCYHRSFCVRHATNMKANNRFHRQMAI